MLIHTDSPGIVENAIIEAALKLDNVFWATERGGSESRSYSIDLHLEGSGLRGNTATDRGTLRPRATWDEWSVVLAHIFEADRDARTAQYEGLYDFHHKTAGRFDALELPEDTHTTHRWMPREDGDEAFCTKCSAVKRYTLPSRI